MSRLVDAHNHLQHENFERDRDEVLARALENLEWMVVVGDTVEASRMGADLAASQQRVYATAGVHPHNAKDVAPEVIEAIREISQGPRVVAIGEIGLDYHYDFSPRAEQRAALALQLDLAIQERLPVVIHCREAEADVEALIGPRVARLTGGVMHCFSGDTRFARQCLDWGFYVSFAGNVTFPKAEGLREAAKIIPLDRLLVETDAPYLAPQPVRGKRCEPCFVKYTAELLAKLRELPFEELAAGTALNAAAFFGLSGKLSG